MSRFFTKATRTWTQICADRAASAAAAEAWEVEEERNQQAAASARINWEHRPEARLAAARRQAESSAWQAQLEVAFYDTVRLGPN